MIAESPRKQSMPPRRRVPALMGLWHSIAFRNLLYQLLVVSVLIGTAIYLVGNAQEAMKSRGIASGFAFLFEEAGFPISEGLIGFQPTDNYLRAFLTAISNTLTVSIAGIICATVLGTIIGIARLSRNWLIARLASIYVEAFRNTPQLLQIIFWYTLLTRLPQPRQAWALADWAYLSNRGLVMAWPADNAAPLWLLIALAAGVVAWGMSRWRDRRRRQTGRAVSALWPLAILFAGLSLVVWLAGEGLTDWDTPVLRGFNFVGGITLSPEFIALLLGLSLYIAAFIAEIVRSGIQSVGRGQIEAARAIGLRKLDLYRKVILPQALRVVVPPATAQYISLAKTSSLGVAIGYPELFNITNTAITLSGNTIECVVMMAGVYILIAFAIAAVSNLYNRSIQLQER